jgi:hypothetical protein
MQISREQTVTISPDVLFQEVSGEIVLLDLASEKYFGLDEVGARIWTLLSEGRAVGEVVEALLQEYDVDRATLESDMESLLTSLLEAGLIAAGMAVSVPGGE